MIPRRPSFAPNPRPSSAIYIGSEAIPLLPSPPSPAHSTSSTRSQLPSPPATNSTGSIGDSSSTDTGSVRRLGMVNGDERPPLSDEENGSNNDQENDEDNTAKLSMERRAAKGKHSESLSLTLQRVKSLTERSRKVMDRPTSITTSESLSQSSLSTPSSASSRSRSPLPPSFSSSSFTVVGSSSRVSFQSSLRGGSGSETERERGRQDTILPRPGPSQDASSDDNDTTTPPASTRQSALTFDRTGPRQRLRSAPSPAPKPAPTLSPRKYTSTASFTAAGSGRRPRRVSIQQPEDDVEEEGEFTVHHTVGGGSASKKTRAPLPREFRERRSLDGRSVGESSTAPIQWERRTISPGLFTARGSASANSFGAGGTFTPSPVSPRSQRPARPSTVRESSRRSQKLSSVDDSAMNGDEEGRRQWRHGGSTESPLGGREGRSVVGEGLRAAGLARRGSEDVFVDGISHRRTRTSINDIRGELELQHSKTRGFGPVEDPRDPRGPVTPSSITGRLAIARSNTTVQSVLNGNNLRAGTLLGSHGSDDEAPRAASQPLRSHRTSYGSGARHTPQPHTSPATPVFGRNTPQHISATPSSEHARLMLDSLAIFEGQLARLPPSTPDLVRRAQSVVQSANSLNTLLRAGNARALEAQIEAEVGDTEAMVDASEVWRKVGGEYRESLRMSDELVRTMTALLLGMGRLVREAVKERSSGSSEVGDTGGFNGGVRAERSSLDGDGRERVTTVQRRSVDGDGRRSAEGSAYRDRDRESRRSWEDGESSRRSQTELNSRPPTSLSATRGTVRHSQSQLQNQGHDDGNETARERNRPSALERLSLRRIFTPRSQDSNQVLRDSPNLIHPSPSPTPRSSLDGDLPGGLPPLSVPPPLPSLPSESLLSRKESTQSRRAKVSSTSNATVRGSSIFPTMTSPRNPTTALTPHTVSADEATAFPLLRGDTSSSVLSELQQRQQRDARTRTGSAASAQEASDFSGASGTRVLRGTRARMSLDGAEAPLEHIPNTTAPNSDRRERRRTINEIFS